MRYRTAIFTEAMTAKSWNVPCAQQQTTDKENVVYMHIVEFKSFKKKKSCYLKKKTQRTGNHLVKGKRLDSEKLFCFLSDMESRKVGKN